MSRTITVPLRMAVAYDRRERVRFHVYRAASQAKVRAATVRAFLAANPCPPAIVRPLSGDALKAHYADRMAAAQVILFRVFSGHVTADVDAREADEIRSALAERASCRAALEAVRADTRRAQTRVRVAAHRARKRARSDERVPLTAAVLASGIAARESEEDRQARVRREADALRSAARAGMGGHGGSSDAVLSQRWETPSAAPGTREYRRAVARRAADSYRETILGVTV